MLGKQRIHAGCWIDWDREGVVHGRQFYPLPARTFRILTYLVDHHDQVVAVSTLRQVGWPEPIPTAGGTFYPNADVYPHVHRIRWAIEPDLHHPKWLVTRRDRGIFCTLPRWNRVVDQRCRMWARTGNSAVNGLGSGVNSAQKCKA